VPPLTGLRVLDLGRVLAGGGATRVLANLGAEVLKIEWPEGPGLDSLRTAPPFADGQMMGSLNRSQFFNNVNVDKKSVAIDISSARGRELVLRLAAYCDLVFENATAGAMDRLGLGYAAIAQVRPDVIYISQPGWGSAGPYARYRSYGPTAQAFSGLTAMSGLAGGEPAGWGFSYLDHMPAYYAAAAAITGVYHRLRTGEGQRIEVPQVIVGCTLSPIAILEAQVCDGDFASRGRPRGNAPARQDASLYGVFPCLEPDTWCAIEVYGQQEWHNFVTAIGSPAWAASPRFETQVGRAAEREALNNHVAAWCRERDAYEVMQLLQAHGVAAGVCQTGRQKLAKDPQLDHRRTFPRMVHPETGIRAYDGQPLKFSRSPADPSAPTPTIGQHTDETLLRLLGLTAEELLTLRAEQVIA
jgi:benzylsuccinate CoA-transferase BbsF subunit